LKLHSTTGRINHIRQTITGAEKYIFCTERKAPLMTKSIIMLFRVIRKNDEDGTKIENGEMLPKRPGIIVSRYFTNA
jgi:hypothetical protein